MSDKPARQARVTLVIELDAESTASTLEGCVFRAAAIRLKPNDYGDWLVSERNGDVSVEYSPLLRFGA